jgi:hypothetical protein
VDQQQQPRWQPTRRQLLWAGAAIGLLTIAVLVGYRYGITLWNWIKLLIVPAVIASAGLWFNAQQREREQNIAQQRAQEEALQAYLDHIGQLLLDKDRPLRQAKERDDVRTLARARTLTVLASMDPSGKTRIMRFLVEANLVQGGHEGGSIIGLSGADLSGTDLHGADMNNADLSCIVEETELGPFKSCADLSGTNLIKANLVGANLSGADLSRADLTSALVTSEQLDQAGSLKGATLPDGYKLS